MRNPLLFALLGPAIALCQTAQAPVAQPAKAAPSEHVQQCKDILDAALKDKKTMFMFAVRTGASIAPVPGLGAGVSSMQALLSDPAVSGRATAVLLLEKDKDAETLSAQKEALEAKEWSVRAAGVHALVLRDNPAFQSNIVPLLDDKNDAVKLRAAAGYLRLETIKNAKPTRKRPAVTKASPAPPAKS